MKDRKGDYIYEDHTHTESLPDLEFLESHDFNPTSHPADWYNVLIPRSTRRQDNNEVTSIADFIIILTALTARHEDIVPISRM